MNCEGQAKQRSKHNSVSCAKGLIGYAFMLSCIAVAEAHKLVVSLCITSEAEHGCCRRGRCMQQRRRFCVTHLWDDTVELGALEAFACFASAESSEVLRCLWHYVLAQLECDAASVCAADVYVEEDLVV